MELEVKMLQGGGHESGLTARSSPGCYGKKVGFSIA